MRNMTLINEEEILNIVEAFKKLYYITHDGIDDKISDIDLYNRKINSFNSGPFIFKIDDLGLIRFSTSSKDYAFFNKQGICIPTVYGKMSATLIKAMENETIQQLSNTDMFKIFSDIGK